MFFLEKDRVLNGLGLNDTPSGRRNYQATVERWILEMRRGIISAGDGVSATVPFVNRSQDA